MITHFINFSFVSWLLEQGLAVNSVEENGRSPLFLAVSGQHTETARRLIHKGSLQGRRQDFKWGWALSILTRAKFFSAPPPISGAPLQIGK